MTTALTPRPRYCTPLGLPRPAPAPTDVDIAVVAPDDPLAADAEAFATESCRRQGYLPAGATRIEAHDGIRDRSPWVLARRGEEVVATLRIGTGTFDDLPAAHVGQVLAAPVGEVAEFCALAVSPSLRGLGVANDLHRTAIAYLAALGTGGFVCAVESWHADLLASSYALPLVALGPGVEYMGGFTTPYAVDLHTLFHRLAARHREILDWAVEPAPGPLLSLARTPLPSTPTVLPRTGH